MARQSLLVAPNPDGSINEAKLAEVLIGTSIIIKEVADALEGQQGTGRHEAGRPMSAIIKDHPKARMQKRLDLAGATEQDIIAAFMDEAIETRPFRNPFEQGAQPPLQTYQPRTGRGG